MDMSYQWWNLSASANDTSYITQCMFSCGGSGTLIYCQTLNGNTYACRSPILYNSWKSSEWWRGAIKCKKKDYTSFLKHHCQTGHIAHVLLLWASIMINTGTHIKAQVGHGVQYTYLWHLLHWQLMINTCLRYTGGLLAHNVAIQLNWC